MIIPTVVFTTLPRFAKDGRYHFSLHVSLRLDPPGVVLADYSLGNWPNAVLGMALGGTLWLQFDAAANPLIPATVETAPLRPDLWDQLFPPASTFVQPYAFKNNALRPMYSFSVSALEAYFESLYAQVANASSTTFPDLKAPGPLHDLAEAVGRGFPIMRRGLDKPKSQLQPGPHPDLDIENQLNQLGSSVPLAELYRAFRFYRRGNEEKWSDFNFKSQQEPSVPALIPEPVQVPTIDFHQVTAMLGDHPFLMRAFGLVIDVSVSERDLGGPLAALGAVRAQVQWGPPYPAPTDKTPWTHYEHTTTTFLPRPRKTGDILGGFLKLHEAQRFDVFQTDADGNALKTLDFAVNMQSKLTQLLSVPVGETQPWVPVDQPAPESLPAQRNGGLTVVRKERDQKIHFDLEQQRDINSVLGSAEVEYDDVARGYRIDVLDRGRWRSLCFRRGQYLFGGIGAVVPGAPDEGYIKAASATSDPPANAPPGGNGAMYLHEAVFGWDNWSLVAPRPGQTISFDRDDSTRTQQLKIEKPVNTPPPEFDLVPEFSVLPGTLPRMRFGESYTFRARVVDLAGNSLDHTEADVSGVPVSKTIDYLRYEPLPVPVLVLREAVTPGESVEHLVVRSRVGDPIPDEGAIFNDECKRFVAPPKVSQIMAEMHGAFDPYWSDPDLAYGIALKEAGTLTDPGLPDIDVLDISGNSVGFPAEFKRGDALPDSHHYVVHTGPGLLLPYLPDPLALGLVLQGLPGLGPLRRPYPGIASWPDYEPFSLTLGKTMTPAPVLSPLPNFTGIDLPPATILKLKYSSAITAEGLKLMARWHTLTATMRAEVMTNAGQHWMITPYRVVTLVHAVERPLEEPTFLKTIGFNRLPGQTFVTLTRGQFECHSHSTGQLETFARWTETLDRVDDPAPVTEPRDGRVFETKVAYEQTLVEFGPERHEFGDTKHRMVQYYPVGTTRYREYFPPSITSKPELITLEGPPYEPAPGALFVNVPSSALPHPPRVLYVVPTFKWVESGDGLTRERVGRGLRIYLDRPWYSSGEGELLGIVISRPGDELTPDLRKFVSEWGADPVYSSTGPISPLAFGHFVPDPDAPEFTPVSGVGRRLPERDTAVFVDVVGIKPEFNHDRKVWFVDLELNCGVAFAPFVRFSLCRYQPSSLNGLHLSKLVKTEFAQLLADRTATLQHVGANDLEITLSGPASRNQIGAFLPQPSGPPIPIVTDPLGPITRAKVKPGPLPVPDPGPIIVNPPPFYVKDAYAGAGRIVRAHFERLDNPASEDFGWVSVGGVYVLESYTSIFEPGVVSWIRTVPKPAGWETSGKRHRLVIGESEFFETDEETSHPVPVFNPSALALRERLVYVDTFELT